jgi:alpha-1,2-mannosyltransferase
MAGEGRTLQRLLTAVMTASALWHGYDVATADLVDRAGRLKAPDFVQFYTFGAIAAAGDVTTLYSPAAHSRAARSADPRLTLSNFHPNYPPVVAWLLAPLATLQYGAALLIFSALSVLAGAAGCVILTRRLNFLHRRRALAMIATLACPAFYATLRYGQLSSFTLLILCAAAAAYAANRRLLAGVALGLIGFKPHLVLSAIVVLAFARERRVLAGLFAGGGLGLFLSLLAGGPTVLADYLSVLVELARNPQVVQFFPAEAHSVAGFFGLLVQAPRAGQIAGWVSLPVVAYGASMVWRRQGDWRPRWAALVTAMVLASPHLLTYDLLLLLIPVLLLGDWHFSQSGHIPVGAWSWTLALLYLAAWPGTLIARMYHVQPSTIGMCLALWLLARAPRADPS